MAVQDNLRALKWSPAEDAVLYAWAAAKWVEPYASLAERLPERTVNACAARANALGIGRPRGYRHLSPDHEWDDRASPKRAFTPAHLAPAEPLVLDHWDRATRRLVKKGWIHAQSSA